MLADFSRKVPRDQACDFLWHPQVDRLKKVYREGYVYIFRMRRVWHSETIGDEDPVPVFCSDVSYGISVQEAQ